MSSPDDVVIKKITVACDFNGQSSPTVLMIGNPQKEHHPVQFQAKWLGDKGGNVPSDIMDSLTKLYELADKNHVCFPELCEYAIESANEDNEANEDSSVLLDNDDSKDESDDENPSEDITDEDTVIEEERLNEAVPLDIVSHSSLEEEPSLPSEAPESPPPVEIPSTSVPLEIPKKAFDENA